MADERHGWMPIEELSPHQQAMVGRWNGTGSGTIYWSQVTAAWFTAPNGGRVWTYEESRRKSPFYDELGNYAEPTHFHLIPPPPPEPVA